MVSSKNQRTHQKRPAGEKYVLEISHIYLNKLKGTVSVISSDSPCKDDSVRFTTVPLKP